MLLLPISQNHFTYLCHRYVTVVPLPSPRRTIGDTTLRGYKIPDGTSILPNVYAVCHDPDQWDQPNEFDPAHFLDENGKFQKKESFAVFTMGK